MTPLVPIAFIGWLPVSLILFATMSARRAMLTAAVAGSLFLPETVYKFPGIPDVTKRTVIAYGLILAILSFDSRRLNRLRLTLWDVPIICWCIVPGLAALSNGLGPYDAASSVFQRTMLWGVFWFAGRMYLSSAAGLRELMWAIFLGGLVYVPLCLYELRMSPVLHSTIYGFHQHHFLQTVRDGGYRPMVFLRHGLELTMWLTMAALMGTGLWKTTARGHPLRVPIGLGVLLLVLTTASCHSVGAVVLMAIGLGLVLTIGSSFGQLAWAGLLVFLMAYVGSRSLGLWDARSLPDLAASFVSRVRANSLGFRIAAENLLLEKGLSRPLLGWGGWTFNRVEDAELGTRSLIADSEWIIAMMKNGLIGLASFFLAFWAAGAGALARLAGIGNRRRLPVEAGPVALGVTLYLADSMANAFPGVAYLAAAGGLTGVLSARVAFSPARISSPAKVSDRRPTVQSAVMLLRPRAGGLAHGLRTRSRRPMASAGGINQRPRSQDSPHGQPQ